MKNIKIIIFVTIIFSTPLSFIEAKEKKQNNNIKFKEELYFNKQIPVKISPESKLESIFYFNNQLKAIPQSLTPVKNKYKTHLKIPKANLN